eukprot:Plantae.Rhodophyta-Hildenbrandia_rubra.ctg11618.p1 GENE.Plantae.Rhodophyta-Hildenbrandia_rubra.ctg11618~~Plantae.Rhodophyta-Hildenbrandia_rubra.ctg11618.p1  ORF type:complete len:534 (+),score=91.74 Plantae.Rhodophyta-Hildenbrandia_rubra.ctg11618:92-1603(+)
MHNAQDQRFNLPKKKEWDGLMKSKTFACIDEKEIAKDANILNGRFVLGIKDPDAPDEIFKARFAMQGHVDKHKESMLKEAPTIMKRSIRLLLAIASAKGFYIWTRDATQAYMQSDENLLRDVCLRPPSTMKIPEGKMLKIVKPMHGLTEAGACWWLSSKDYHLNDLEMKQTALDPCLFCRQSENDLIGMQGALVDDTLGAGAKEFMELEEEKCKRFKVKPKKLGDQLRFSGCDVDKRKDGTWMLSQMTYVKKLQILPKSEWTFEKFRSRRGKISWAASCSRPDAAYMSAKLAQVTADNISQSDYQDLSAAIRHIKRNNIFLRHPKINLEKAKLCCFTDASFANNDDLTSQLGMIALSCDHENNCSIAQHGSWKRSRVTRSVLAAEMHAFATGFDFTYALQQDIISMTGRKKPVVMRIDSKCLFDTITKLTTLTEKRLLINVSALRESYNRAEISNIAHVSSERNLADSLAKRKKSKLLQEAMITGKLNVKVSNWVIHNELNLE